MIRLAVCLDDSPTMLYSDKVLTKGKSYHVVVESRGLGALVKVLDPDPVLVHEVRVSRQRVRAPSGATYEEPDFTLTGNIARIEPRGAIRMTADRFQILPGSERSIDEIWADAPKAQA